MILQTLVNGVRVEIDLPGTNESAYEAARGLIGEALGRPQVKNREAICEAFLWLIQNCPQANPSDLWHHVVYRLYCEILPAHRPQNPSQSWVRASGDALEMAIE